MGCFGTGNQKEVSGAALSFMEILFQHLDLAGCGIFSISTHPRSHAALVRIVDDDEAVVELAAEKFGNSWL
jgi:hypothetical protein